MDALPLSKREHKDTSKWEKLEHFISSFPSTSSSKAPGIIENLIFCVFLPKQ
jgi:hypothetical protein